MKGQKSLVLDLQSLDLETLFKMVDELGSKRFNRLTRQDLEDYEAYERWRYISGDFDLGTTPESKEWVRQNSTSTCPVCGDRYGMGGNKWKNIDHKLPRSQYPWLAMNFQNFWVICEACNKDKAEMNWFQYEMYIFKNHADRYQIVHNERPEALLKSLLAEQN